jgi:hypothetical protein
VEDPCQRRQQEAIRPVVRVQGRPQVQQLGQRSRVERKRDLDRQWCVRPDRRHRPASEPRPCRRDEHVFRSGCGDRGVRETIPFARGSGPAEAQARQTGLDLRPARRVDLCGRQQMGERVEVVSGPHSPLRAGLERRRPAAAEGIEDHVTGSRVAGDECVRQTGREARQVRAHRMEAVAPQPLLALPFRFDRERRDLGRELERQLADRGHELRPGAAKPWVRRRSGGVVPIDVERKRCHEETTSRHARSCDGKRFGV